MDIPAIRPYKYSNPIRIRIFINPLFGMGCVKWGGKRLCLVYPIQYYVITNSSMLDRIHHALHIWACNKRNRSWTTSVRWTILVFCRRSCPTFRCSKLNISEKCTPNALYWADNLMFVQICFFVILCCISVCILEES